MKKILLLACAVFLFPSFARAQDLFTVNIQQGGRDQTVGFKSIIDLFDRYEDGSLDRYIQGYDRNAASQGAVNFRGVELRLGYDGAGNLHFTAPALGIDRNYSGSDLEGAFKALTDDLKKDSDGLLKKLLKATVSSTPFDLVAGNPNSLMASMADFSFARGGGLITDTSRGYILPTVARGSISHKSGDADISIYHLPLAASFHFGEEDEWAFLLDAPFSYYDFEGSIGYAAQLGLGLRIPLVSRHWYLTPALRGGAIGSEDMLSGGLLYSGSLTSRAQYPVGPVTLGMTNMLGLIRDFSLTVADYEIAYDLRNTVFKNGLDLTWNFVGKWEAGISYAYSVYGGTDLYIDNYHEVGLALQRGFTSDSFVTALGLSGKYSFSGDRYKGWELGLTLLF
jgi:hypothetical protein